MNRRRILRFLAFGLAGWVFLVLVVVGLIAFRYLTTYKADLIPDSALLPLPSDLLLANSDEGDCGNGNDYECGRTFIVQGTDRAPVEVVLERVSRHLRQPSGWRVIPREMGIQAASFENEGGHPCTESTSIGYPNCGAGRLRWCSQIVAASRSNRDDGSERTVTWRDAGETLPRAGGRL